MNLAPPSRRVVLIGGGLLLAAALWIALPFLNARRGVERAWDEVLSAIEDKDSAALERLLGDDYSDGFGLDREGAVRLAATVRSHFVTCSVAREQSELVMDPSKKSAVTRALIRLGGGGSPVAQAAIQASTASQTPTAFRWRRNSWKPWDWRLVSIDNLDASRAIKQFQHDAGSLGFTP